MGASCLAPTGVHYFPYYTTHAIGLPELTADKLLPLEDGDIAMVTCSYCGRSFQGLVRHDVCLTCLKSKKLFLGLKPGSSVSFSRRERANKENYVGLSIYGPVVGARAYGIYASSRVNETRSIAGRQTAPTPPPNRRTWKSFEKWIFSQIDDIFPSLTPGCCSPGDDLDERFAQWNTGFPKGTIKANEVAWSFVRRHPLTERLLSKSLIVKMFQKREKADGCDMACATTTASPRCISAWPPRANVATGLPIKEFTDRVTRDWSDHTRSVGNPSICYPSHMNLEQLSSWFTSVLNNTARGWIGYEDDFTLYDSSQNEMAHAFMMKLYERAGLFGYPWFEQIRKGQGGCCFGRGRHGTQYIDYCTLKSGSADTSLMNTVINCLSHYYSIACTNLVDGVPLSFKAVAAKVVMMILGDDNGMMVAPDIDMSGVTTVLCELGYMSKLKRRDKCEDIVFLSNSFIEIEPNVWRAVPNPLKLFGKWGYATDPQPDPMSWVNQVAKAFLPALSPLTIGHKACSHLIKVSGSRLTNGGVNKNRTVRFEPTFNVQRSLNWKYRLWADTEIAPTEFADRSYCRKFELDYESQYLPMVEQLCSYSRLPCNLSFDHINYHVKRCS